MGCGMLGKWHIEHMGYWGCGDVGYVVGYWGCGMLRMWDVGDENEKSQNVGFFIFKFALKYMLGNVYVNKIYAMHLGWPICR